MAEKICPPVLVNYTLFSTLASIAVAILSVLCCGTLALWFNTAASILTLLYLTVILFFVWRRSLDPPTLVHRMHVMYSSKALTFSALVLLLWMASLGSSLEQLVNRRTDSLFSVKKGPANMEMQIAVSCLIFVEILAVGAWIIHTLHKRPRRVVRQELEVMVERSVYSPSSVDLLPKENKKKSRYLSQTRFSALLRHQSIFNAAKHQTSAEILQAPPPVATKEADRAWSFVTPMAPTSPSFCSSSRYGNLWD